MDTHNTDMGIQASQMLEDSGCMFQRKDHASSTYLQLFGTHHLLHDLDLPAQYLLSLCTSRSDVWCPEGWCAYVMH